MKKLLSILSVILVLCSCNKKDEAPTASASWKLGTTTYTQALSIKQPIGPFVQYLALDKIYTSAELSNNSNSTKTFNGFMVMFKSAPTAAGKYKIVLKNDPTSLAADEMMFTMQDKTMNKQFAATTSSVLADVTVNAGKITVVIPTTKVLEVGTLGGTTLDASGTFVEM
ncbi:MAG: hypothetical protein ACOVNY_03430 [Chitinophagaceae bacterium]